MSAVRLSPKELKTLAELTARLTTNEAAEIAAERAAAIVLERIYSEIGKVTVRALLWLAGTAGAALIAWLGIFERIKP